MTVRRASLEDLPSLVDFTMTQIHEGEGAIKGREVVERGIRQGLMDESLALYWVLVDANDHPVGCASATKEWSNWNAGFYWWIQSMFVSPMQRGQGGMKLLIDAIRAEMIAQEGIQLRIYVNKDNRAAKGAYERSNFRLSVYEIMMMIDD